MSPKHDDLVLIQTNFPTLQQAEQAAGDLVAARLAAAVNIQPGLISIFAWQGSITRAEEVAVSVKTVARHAAAVMTALARRHPYETPAMIVLPVASASAGYGQWVRQETAI